ncbi:PKD domain-containing protein [Nocardioides sp. WS12]|uniref:PKD domain-containing protein n=1 Tax=Nocardioides sp. WS12 TaxID=2486272 RepID=UPI0015FE2B5F|nr:PKD domain-containing protein [Nocardioides sp. WS12]
MNRRSVPVLILALVSFTSPAHAFDDDSGTTDDSIWAELVQKEADERGGAIDDSPAAPLKEPETPQIVLQPQTCVSTDQISEEILGSSSATFCSEPEPNAPVLTVGIVRTAFAELKLPAAKLVIQPPDGLTLVNFDTNFYTTSTRPISRTVTLLGQQVTLEATPAEFHWTFGDGQALATTEPGAPYPDLTVTHNYLRTGTYQPSLATVFTGRFRVGGGPWRQIPGTVTIEGAGQALRAIEAQPKLVGY